MNRECRLRLEEFLLEKAKEIARNETILDWLPNISLWIDYVESVGCRREMIRFDKSWDRSDIQSFAAHGTQVVFDPFNPTKVVVIPDDIALKALMFGGFPSTESQNK